jgi:Zn-dependent M28 family amino/carboxypeptidase
VGPEEPIALANVEIGALMDDVSSDNITSSIDDLVGFGTRYYTTQHNAEAAEYLYTRLEAYGLRVWYEDFLSWEGYLMVNVVGEVPGEDDSAIYGVMAHFDTISSDLSNAPGADDNATGISASLEIARILSQYELVHPVQIIFVNVEEVGIVGSNQFAANVAEKGIPLEGVFNLDSVGAHRQYNYMVVNGSSETRWMVELYRRLNDAYGLGQVINAQTNDQIVADDNRLRDHGIDSIMIARELYGQSPYHHTPQDTVDTLRIEGVVSCARLTLLSLAELARA